MAELAASCFVGYGLGSGSALWRVVLPAGCLGAPVMLRNSMGGRVSSSEGFPVDPSGWVVVVQQPTQGWMFNELRTLRDPGRGGAAGVVVGVDDALWALPRGHVNRGAFTKEVVDVFKRSASVADGVVASTGFLGDWVVREGLQSRDRVWVVPNGVDLWRYPRGLSGLKESLKDGVVRVGFAGGSGHAGLLAQVWDGVCAAVGDVGGELVEIGEPSGLRVPSGVAHRVVPWEVDVSVYPQRYARWLDIGLAVSDSSTFFRAKSPLRLVEYGLCGVAGVAMGPTYRPGLEGAPSGSGGLYAWNERLDHAWAYDQIVKLAGDRGLREGLASRLGLWARQDASIEAMRPLWEQVVTEGRVREGVAA